MFMCKGKVFEIKISRVGTGKSLAMARDTLARDKQTCCASVVSAAVNILSRQQNRESAETHTRKQSNKYQRQGKAQKMEQRE